MENVTAIVAMEVTEEEMKEVVRLRERKAQEDAIREKGEQINQLIKEIKALGGHVNCVRSRKSTYFSTYGERVIGVIQPYSRQVEIVIT